jgi:quinolinate synthase
MGSCVVHETFSERKIVGLQASSTPTPSLIAHPECEEPILRLADFIGSTTALLQHRSRARKAKFIVATESGIVHQMRKACPDKVFIEGPPEGTARATSART